MGFSVLPGDCDHRSSDHISNLLSADFPGLLRIDFIGAGVWYHGCHCQPGEWAMLKESSSRTGVSLYHYIDHGAMVKMTEQLPDYLVLREEQWNIMLVDVIKRAPEEACGLLGGKGRDVVDVIPVTNVLHSPVRYQMAPEEQLAAFN